MAAVDTGWAVGLDVGGTKTAAALVVFPSGRMLQGCRRDTEPERGGEAVLADALDLGHALIGEGRKTGLVFGGIGVGVAELVNLDGKVTSAHTIAWEGLAVRERFAELGPAKIDADVRTAALGEARFGAGRSFGTFVYVSVGTGIGCCLVQDGKPYAGARGNALIVGSSPLSTTCSDCGKDLHPILEEFASGPAIVERYNSAGGSVLRGEEVFTASARGDDTAQEVLGTSGDALGVSVGFLVNVLDPEAIVVGGGLGLAGGLYWERFVQSTRDHIWAGGSRGLPILTAGLGEDAGAVGAAAGVMTTEITLPGSVDGG